MPRLSPQVRAARREKHASAVTSLSRDLGYCLAASPAAVSFSAAPHALGQIVAQELSFHTVPPPGAVIAGDVFARAVANAMRSKGQESENRSRSQVLAGP